MSVIRPGLTDPDGPCANAIPQDDDKTVSLQPGKEINDTDDWLFAMTKHACESVMISLILHLFYAEICETVLKNFHSIFSSPEPKAHR